MKARVKATGEIEEFQVNELNEYFTKDGVHYKGFELDFDYEPDYWEKLKHQYAGMAMQGILSNPDIELDFEGNETCVQAVAQVSIKLATALINKLKEEKQ